MRARADPSPGDGVLIFTPVYGPFYASIKENGRRIVESPMARDALGRYTLNLADAEGKHGRPRSEAGHVLLTA